MKRLKNDWFRTNKRRCELIRRDVKGALTPAEKKELARLEDLADERLEALRSKEPEKEDEIGKVVARLKSEGKWPA